MFDLIFGIDTPPIDADDFDDVADSAEDAPNPCKCDRKECGQANQETRIVGGKPTGVNQYPWIARLVYDGHFHCGASLITKEYVLTAAHCVRRVKRSKIRIILGDHDQTVTSDADAKMRAIECLLQTLYVCFNLKMKLWNFVGRVSEQGALPSVVQHVEVPILSLTQCRSMKYRSSRITPNMVCAGKGKQDSCQGDSGGPLVVFNNGKFEIVGIVSWGVGCGRAGYPGVYTRVSRYMPWIRANVEGCVCN